METEVVSSTSTLVRDGILVSLVLNFIVVLLEQPNLLEQNMVNKERWVEIMTAAGLDEEAMKNWHKQFEAMEPESHQEFLESLSISNDEIKAIRQWSKE